MAGLPFFLSHLSLPLQQKNNDISRWNSGYIRKSGRDGAKMSEQASKQENGKLVRARMVCIKHYNQIKLFCNGISSSISNSGKQVQRAPVKTITTKKRKKANIENQQLVESIYYCYIIYRGRACKLEHFMAARY